MKIRLEIVVFASLLLLIPARPAHAYMDPGSGSMLLQLILGGVAGLGLAVKLFWHHILAFFGIRKEDKSTQEKK